MDKVKLESKFRGKTWKLIRVRRYQDLVGGSCGGGHGLGAQVNNRAQENMEEGQGKLSDNE